MKDSSNKLFPDGEAAARLKAVYIIEGRSWAVYVLPDSSCAPALMMPVLDICVTVCDRDDAPGRHVDVNRRLKVAGIKLHVVHI